MDYVKYIRGMVGHNKIIMHACGAIITNGDMVLLQKRSDTNEWGLFGGIMEMNESLHDCAKREVKEETGLDVNLDYLVGIYHNYDCRWPSGDEAHVICTVFKASIIAGSITIDSESLGYKWFDINNLPVIGSVDHKKALEDFKLGLRNQID